MVMMVMMPLVLNSHGAVAGGGCICQHCYAHCGGPAARCAVLVGTVQVVGLLPDRRDTKIGTRRPEGRCCQVPGGLLIIDRQVRS